MQAISARYFFTLFIIIWVVIVCNNLIFGDESCSLKFHKVIDNQLIKTEGIYEPGRKLYSDYKLFGLSDNFYIKRVEDLSIENSDIDEIVIHQNEFCLPNRECFNIIFSISESTRYKLMEYTRLNIFNKVAFKINGRILIIATISEEIDTKLIVPLINKTLPEIKRILDPLKIDIKFGRGTWDDLKKTGGINAGDCN